MGRAWSARSTLCARRERDGFAGGHRRTNIDQWLERSAQGPRDIGVLLRGLHGEAWILDRAAVNASSAHLREGLSNADRLLEVASIGSIDNIIFSGGDTHLKSHTADRRGTEASGFEHRATIIVDDVRRSADPAMTATPTPQSCSSMIHCDRMRQRMANIRRRFTSMPFGVDWLDVGATHVARRHPAVAYALINPISSSLTRSFSVVHMPWGAPL